MISSFLGTRSGWQGVLWTLVLGLSGCEGCTPLPSAEDAGADAGRPSGFDAGTLADSGLADSGFADSGFADSGFADSGFADSGFADSGFADSGFADSGFADSGFADSGFADSGFADSGFVDAGFVDAGFTDSGIRARCDSAEECSEDQACSEFVATPAEDDFFAQCRAADANQASLLEKCSTSSSCESQFCASRAKVCSEACQVDPDCGSAGRCTAYPLLTPSGQSSFEKLCVVGCERNTDCPSDRFCTYNGNPLTQTYDAICEEAVGDSALLSPCAVDAECQSGLCVLDVCSAPCVQNADCPGGTCIEFVLAEPTGSGDVSAKFCQSS